MNRIGHRLFAEWCDSGRISFKRVSIDEGYHAIDVLLVEPGTYRTKIFYDNARYAARFNDPEEFLVAVPDPETVAFCAFGVPVPLLVITVVPDAEDS